MQKISSKLPMFSLFIPKALCFKSKSALSGKKLIWFFGSRTLKYFLSFLGFQICSLGLFEGSWILNKKLLQWTWQRALTLHTGMAAIKPLHRWIVKTNLGSGCDSVSRAVTSDTRGPGFESNLRQSFIHNMFAVNCWKDKNKEKEASNYPFEKPLQGH